MTKLLSSILGRFWVDFGSILVIFSEHVDFVKHRLSVTLDLVKTVEPAPIQLIWQVTPAIATPVSLASTVDQVLFVIAHLASTEVIALILLIYRVTHAGVFQDSQTSTVKLLSHAFHHLAKTEDLALMQMIFRATIALALRNSQTLTVRTALTLARQTLVKTVERVSIQWRVTLAIACLRSQASTVKHQFHVKSTEKLHAAMVGLA